MKPPCIIPELNQRKNLEGDLKDIYIKILSPLSLEDDDNDRIFLVERLLTIIPHPDVVSGEEANRDDLGATAPLDTLGVRVLGSPIRPLEVFSFHVRIPSNSVWIRKTGDDKRPFSAPLPGSRPSLTISMPNNSSPIKSFDGMTSVLNTPIDRYQFGSATTKDIWPISVPITNAPNPPFVDDLMRSAGWPTTSAEHQQQQTSLSPCEVPGVGSNSSRVAQSDEIGYFGMRKQYWITKIIRFLVDTYVIMDGNSQDPSIDRKINVVVESMTNN
ncbi:15090_t:CDS:2 [Funneliformis geosporum]|uniref:15090_t:CDS:1 n=1 Tax=Funneliformis geosporum TaxID=1117311 RepID=A0A9W4SCK3_9GLOM|nr:15090_t:CDS:2 [Funneliformis geosporum]